ncbi:M43 family zinc metalloprotease, partial [uncultured Planktosalinus sp.]|uniref:M43 family zinc metalloprotease n=1 Tax=uncultured Planktosalinus sp. TaxID=1810935 RepID=UPI0030D998B4
MEIILNKVEEKIQQKNQVEKPVSKEKLPVKTSSSDKTVYRKNESNNYEIVIPVAFHVVSDSIPDSSIDISEFKEAIEYLNKGFNNVDKKVINPAYRDIIGKANINFVLANSVCKSLKSVSYHKTNKKVFNYYDSTNFFGDLPYDKSLKINGYIDSDKVLNVWVCNLKTNPKEFGGGYSTFPTETNKLNDGIVMDWRFLFYTDKYFGHALFVHEVGHWLGLKHIWGKASPNCLTSPDDGIHDTPAQKKPNQYEAVKKGIVEDVCFKPSEKTNYQ